jgi:hypothetical protein
LTDAPESANRTGMAKAHGHLAPFLQTLRARAGGFTYEYLAAHIEVSTPLMHRRMHCPAGLGSDKIIKLAKHMGATSAELARVRALDALDRGALPIPDGASEAQVAKAMAALEGR